MPSSSASTDPPLFASAGSAAEAIRHKRISSFELTRDALQRIDRHNARLNAVVAVDPERALAAARDADDVLARGIVLGPLHGVPCSVKDAFKVRGIRTTAGAGFLARYVPDEDACVVRRLRDAGAVIVGKTNTAGPGGDWQTYNEVFGATHNPWDVTRTCGGSSGGAAASLAAGFDYVGIGSDLGGSIRGPAHFCGVCGHKPSANVVPMRGHIPPLPTVSAPDHEVLSVAGPLARTPEDLDLVLRVIGGPDGAAAAAYRWTMPPPRWARLSEYRIGYVMNDVACPISSELTAPLAAALEAVAASGAVLHEGWPRDVFPLDHFRTFQYLAATHFASSFSVQQLTHFQTAASRTGSDHATIFARALTQPIAYYQRALAKQAAARQAWQAYFTGYDAFLMPVTFVPAFKHDHTLPQGQRTLETPEGPRSYLDLPFWPSFASLAGLPATTIPVGATAAGLPVGLQVVGPYLEDGTPLALAAHISALLGRPLQSSCPPIDPRSVTV